MNTTMFANEGLFCGFTVARSICVWVKRMHGYFGFRRMLEMNAFKYGQEVDE
ncbi:MAG TPA: hypothetical protein VJZ03_09335 [Candidatus Bathyarchaeia archaeon]|nr:hypothetical protein [Candidatus Bathyarchaeia archaeon]